MAQGIETMKRTDLIEKMYALAVADIEASRTMTVQEAASRYSVDPAALVHRVPRRLRRV